MEEQMQHKKVQFIVLILLIFQLTGLQAQETVPVTGGNATGSGGAISYSVGQVSYSALTGPGGSVVQGVQQPFEISVVTGIEEANGIKLICSVYPNPTTEFLTLKVENYDLKNLSYKLFDAIGNQLESKKITGDQTIIPMGNLVIASYFLIITDNKKEIKSFKIIKN